ncbi:bile acid:sodium symporter family protein [Silvimonas sp.]|uniref:bile acid:sodium symporter family protein n=1 Tax=Silvimonas sp. TaxID=2650811 RepID=UPI00284857B6|nr:bile acid:sodium symporter family protein [Silvimonas sp.]MDR3427688.1 bile acid:sodium symporter [Silvimonas sp.]
MKRPRFLPDNFTLALIATVITASFLPVQGHTAVAFGWVTNFAIGLLFFLHGAKLSREAVIAGATHWRLHAVVMLSTFVMFPLIGVMLKPLLSPLVTPDLYMGVLFLCALPSTVQSSIAFTSMARGNVPAAICSASASNLFGIFLTPVIVGLMISGTGKGGFSFDSILSIVEQLLLPFIAGQIARKWIGGWVDRNKGVLKYVDQGSILLVVYAAFSEAVVQGLWHNTPVSALCAIVVVNIAVLALVLTLTTYGSRALGFNKEDEITIVFCGSKKSLASGVPIANVLFAGHAVGAIVLPLMLFHQIQLMTCAVLAQKYAQRKMAKSAEAPLAVATPK